MKLGKVEFSLSAPHFGGEVLSTFWGPGSHLAQLTEEGLCKKSEGGIVTIIVKTDALLGSDEGLKGQSKQFFCIPSWFNVYIC